MYDWLGTVVGCLSLTTYAVFWIGGKIAHLPHRIDRPPIRHITLGTRDGQRGIVSDELIESPVAEAERITRGAS